MPLRHVYHSVAAHTYRNMWRDAGSVSLEVILLCSFSWHVCAHQNTVYNLAWRVNCHIKGLLKAAQAGELLADKLTRKQSLLYFVCSTVYHWRQILSSHQVCACRLVCSKGVADTIFCMSPFKSQVYSVIKPCTMWQLRIDLLCICCDQNWVANSD